MPRIVDGDNLLGTWPGRKRSDSDRRQLARDVGRWSHRERRRERLRTRLMIDLLQSLVLQEVTPPSLEEARKRAEQVGADDDARRVELRSLRFDDPEQALKVHKDLRRNRLTFGEAVVRNTEDESQGVSTVVDWATLPPPVRDFSAKNRFTMRSSIE